MNIGSPPPVINYNPMVPCANFSDKRRLQDACGWQGKQSEVMSRLERRLAGCIFRSRRVALRLASLNRETVSLAAKFTALIRTGAVRYIEAHENPEAAAAAGRRR